MGDVLRLRVSEEGAAGLTASTIERLLSSVRQAGDARVVVLEGSIDAFCRGLDLAEAQRDAENVGRASVEGTLGLLQQLLVALRRAPQPVLAVVDGEAMGGGVGLVAAADVVIASPRASFSLPETLFGLIPGVIFPYLAERIGIGRARAMAMTGDRVDVSRAADWGLVDIVSDSVGDAEAALLRRLLRQDASAQAELKRLLTTHTPGTDDWAEAAVAAFSGLFSGPRARTRIARFAEGRKPWEETS